jgi:hypothetical protein
MRKGIIIFIVLTLVGLIVYNIAWFSSVKEVTITVSDKERIVESDGDGSSSKYLIFTENGTFENTDSFWFWKWNSSDFQGKLHVDSTYNVKVVGWRIPFLSMYPNIIEIK